MAKFNAVERHFIELGIRRVEAEFLKEIAEANGRHLFSANYGEQLMTTIMEKMDDFTSAKAKKSMNKQKQTV